MTTKWLSESASLRAVPIQPIRNVPRPADEGGVLGKLRYGSLMMGLRHVSRRQALHLNQMGTADRQIRGVSLLVKDEYECAGDHAGGWETSHMLAIHPETVDLSLLPSEGEKLIGAGGKMDPRESNAEFGRETIEKAVDAALREVKNRLENPGRYRGHGTVLLEGE